MTDDKITTAIEAMAEAIYEQNPMRDADQDPDGRQIGDAYDVEFKDLLEMDNGLYELATDQAKAALRAFLNSPEMVRVREALKPFAEMLNGFKEWHHPGAYVPSQSAHPEHRPVLRVTWPDDKDKSNFREIYVSDFRKIVKALSALDELERKLKETADGDS